MTLSRSAEGKMYHRHVRRSMRVAQMLLLALLGLRLSGCANFDFDKIFNKGEKSAEQVITNAIQQLDASSADWKGILGDAIEQLPKDVDPG